jgi:protein-disulfide isomerase
LHDFRHVEYLVINKSTQQSRAWEASDCAAGQETAIYVYETGMFITVFTEASQ